MFAAAMLAGTGIYVLVAWLTFVVVSPPHDFDSLLSPLCFVISSLLVFFGSSEIALVSFDV